MKAILKWIKHSLRKNLKIKLTSILISIIFCYYMYNEYEKEFQVTLISKLKFINLPVNLYSPDKFDKQKLVIHLKGRKNELDYYTLQKNNINFFVDLYNAKLGKHYYKIELENNKLINKMLNSIEISKNQDSVLIEFQNLVIKEVPIELNIEDLKKEEFNALQINYYPNLIKIKGPEKELSKIENVKTISFVLKKEYDLIVLPLRRLKAPIEIVTDNPYVEVHIKWNTNKKLKLKEVRDINE